MLRRLKDKWDIRSNTQLFLIILIFSITGSSALFAKRFIFNLFNVSDDLSFWLKAPLYISTVVPAYYILLLLYAFIFCQFSFFWNLEKRTFNAIFKSWASKK